MKLLVLTVVALLCALPPEAKAFPSIMEQWEDLEVTPDQDLNTRGDGRGLRRTPQLGQTPVEEHETPHRNLLLNSLLGSLVGISSPPPPPPATSPAPPTARGSISDPSAYAKYNPLKDAKCFNDVYAVPMMTDSVRESLYADYVKIFKWGLQNPADSPLHDTSNGVTSNRFAGMCIRMAFHDNTINPGASPLSAQKYVAANIKDGWWTGPSILQTSGGDASLLICPLERLHPNNNYDQTASRVLHAFQTAELYPRGPGITKNDGSSAGLVEKYAMSYADALHNCGLAAITFLTETTSSVSEFQSQTEFVQSDAVNRMSFGRLDACHVTIDTTTLKANIFEYNSRIPLCGTASILPGVNLDATGVDKWFVSRGMAVGAWAALFGVHTTFVKFGMVKTLRNVGVSTHDYFEDYVGCPFLQTKGPVSESSDDDQSGCEWEPQCPSGSGRSSWPMVRSDCATGEFYMGAKVINDLVSSVSPQISDMFYQTNKYVQDVGSWVPDCVCGMIHLGGPDETDCVGPNSVNPARSNSLFGSTYAQNPYPGARFGSYTLQPEEATRFIVNDSLIGSYAPGPGEARFVGYNSLSISVGSDGMVATVDTHNKLWCSILGESWSDLPNDMIDVAVVGNGKYYALGTDQKVYQWSNKKWNYIAGFNIKVISASWDGTVASIHSITGVIYYKTNYDTWGNWAATPGVTNVKDVALVGGGVMYYIASNGDVYRTSNYNSKGVIVGRRGVKISASKDGTVVVLSTDDTVWQKRRDDNIEDWFQVIDKMKVEDIAVMDKDVIFVTEKRVNITYVYRIYLETGSGAPAPTTAPLPVSTTKVGHNAVTIDAASDGTLATANTAREFWKSDRGNGWGQVPQGIVKGVAVVANNQYYAIGSNDHIYRWNGSSFTLMGYNAKTISASWDGTVVITNSFDGQIWHKTEFNDIGNWGVMLGGVTNAKDAAVIGGGTLYYIDSNGDVYRTTTYSNMGVLVGQSKDALKISASRDGTVVVVAGDGTLWRKDRNDTTDQWTMIFGVSTAVDVAVVDSNTIFFSDNKNDIYRIN